MSVEETLLAMFTASCSVEDRAINNLNISLETVQFFMQAVAGYDLRVCT